MIAAGTVFRSVLIWPINTETGDRSKVIIKLEGHTGVIFDVKFI